MVYTPVTIVSSGGSGDVARLSDSTLGADTASFDITGISAAYKHLLIIAQLRGTHADIQTELRLRFNNDSGSNYDGHYHFTTSGAATGVTNNPATTSAQLGLITADTATADRAGSAHILIPNYASATFQKNIEFHTAYARSGDYATTDGSGAWRNTAAVDRITILPGTANWKAGSRLTLYGMN
jgi:hypothetical protein